MRRVVFLAAGFALLTAFGCARKAEVPQDVQEALKSNFPQATQVEWSRESENEFEATFVSEGRKITATFDAAGELLETETQVSKEELPPRVIATIDSLFGDFSLHVAEKIEKPGQPIAYELKFTRADTGLEVVFDDSGRVVEKNPWSPAEEERGEGEEE